MKISARKSPSRAAAPASFTAWLGSHARAVAQRLQQMKDENFGRRFWGKDPALWASDERTARDVSNRLGWLSVLESMRDDSGLMRALISDSRSAGYTHALLLGMGGSSLCPEVLRRTFGHQPGYLDLAVLDSTHPDAVLSAAERAPLERTLFLVSTKSGSTIETSSFFEYFYGLLRRKLGDSAGRHFVAITDPGSPLIAIGESKRFRRIYQNPADIGGRYSALSYFGLVPAALMGIDVNRMVASAASMLPYGPGATGEEHPAIYMGAILGELAIHGRNKLTLALSTGIQSFGCWVEQLVAESTGKQGRGIFPVDGEPLVSPKECGDDRVFVQMKLRGDASTEQDVKLRALEKAGHPVLRIVLNNRLQLGREFFRWEIATAVASSILGVNAFDEPNVSESKANSGRLLKIMSAGETPQRKPSAQAGGVAVFANLPRAAGASAIGPREVMRAKLSRIEKGGYVAILAYLAPSTETDKLLRKLRVSLRDALGVATSAGYGPRYLHSTGQYHKGGPPVGCFLFISEKKMTRAAIAGLPYDFRTLIQAQALGDLEAIESRGLPAVHFSLTDVSAGLRTLNRWATQLGRELRRARK